MLKLHGFRNSNYYNIAKMTLLEKGLEFEEVHAVPSQEPEFLQISPLGKIPVLETEAGVLSETSAIIDYLEDLAPAPALYPDDPFARAQVRELAREIELYIDLAVRPGFREALFGGEVAGAIKDQARLDLDRGVAGFLRRARFAPYVAGTQFTYADIYAYFCFPLAALVARKLWDHDLIAAVPGLKALLSRVDQRPSAAAIQASRRG